MRSLVVVGVFGALLFVASGCSSKGACATTFDDGKTFTCTHMSKSACEQGKGDQFVGGACKDVGYPKKIAKTEDGWEK